MKTLWFAICWKMFIRNYKSIWVCLIAMLAYFSTLVVQKMVFNFWSNAEAVEYSSNSRSLAKTSITRPPYSSNKNNHQPIKIKYKNDIMHCLQSHTIRKFFLSHSSTFSQTATNAKITYNYLPTYQTNHDVTKTSALKRAAAAGERSVSCRQTTNWRIQRCLFLKCFLLCLSGGFMVGRGFPFPENCPLLLLHYFNFNCNGKQLVALLISLLICLMSEL